MDGGQSCRCLNPLLVVGGIEEADVVLDGPDEELVVEDTAKKPASP